MQSFRSVSCGLFLCLATYVLGSEPFRFDQLARSRRIEGFDLSPDGRSIAFGVAVADLDENRMRSTIWMAPSDGGEGRAVTSGDKRDSSPRFSPDGKSLAFLSDRDGPLRSGYSSSEVASREK